MVKMTSTTGSLKRNFHSIKKASIQTKEQGIPKNNNLDLGAAWGPPSATSDVDLQPWHPQHWSTCSAPAPAPSAAIVAVVAVES